MSHDVVEFVVTGLAVAIKTQAPVCDAEQHFRTLSPTGSPNPASVDVNVPERGRAA